MPPPLNLRPSRPYHVTTVHLTPIKTRASRLSADGSTSLRSGSPGRWRARWRDGSDRCSARSSGRVTRRRSPLWRRTSVTSSYLGRWPKQGCPLCSRQRGDGPFVNHSFGAGLSMGKVPGAKLTQLLYRDYSDLPVSDSDGVHRARRWFRWAVDGRWRGGATSGPPLGGPWRFRSHLRDSQADLSVRTVV